MTSQDCSANDDKKKEDPVKSPPLTKLYSYRKNDVYFMSNIQTIT